MEESKSKHLYLPGQDPELEGNYYFWGDTETEEKDPDGFHPGLIRLKIPPINSHADIQFHPKDNSIEYQLYVRDIEGILHLSGSHSMRINQSWHTEIRQHLETEYVKRLPETDPIFIQMGILNAVQWQANRYFTAIVDNVSYSFHCGYINWEGREWLSLIVAEAVTNHRYQDVMQGSLEQSGKQIREVTHEKIVSWVNAIPGVSVEDSWGNSIKILYNPKEMVNEERYKEYVEELAAYSTANPRHNVEGTQSGRITLRRWRGKE